MKIARRVTPGPFVGVLLVALMLALPHLAVAQSTDAPPSPGAAGEGSRQIVNSIGMPLVYIPPGRFCMGSAPSEPARRNDEMQHAVRLTHGYYLGVYEVTQRQFARVLGENPSQFQAGRAFGRRVPDDELEQLPVDSVSWYRAATFCRALSALPAERTAGRSYRLPTEAEWEYACRGGSGAIWSFGSRVWQLEDHAWFQRNAGQRTHAVGLKAANPFGLHDMYGNVWEWCHDWYRADYYQSAAERNPLGPAVGSARVIRGGGWLSPAASCRSAERRSDPPEVADPDTGFRVLMTVRWGDKETRHRRVAPLE